MIELDEKFCQSFSKAWTTIPSNFSEYFDFWWYLDFKLWHTPDGNEKTTLNFCYCNASD